MKKIITGVILGLEITVEGILFIGAFGAGFDERQEIGYLDAVYIAIALAAFACILISVGGLLRNRNGRKFVILPGLGMKVVACCVVFAGYMLDGLETGILPIIAMAALCVPGIRKMKAEGKKQKTGKQLTVSILKFERDKAEWAWEDAAKEFCECYHLSMEDLTDRENDRIYVYACNPIAYLFAWLVKRDFVSPQLIESAGVEELYAIRQEHVDPAEWLYDHMDGILSRDDISRKAIDFLDQYYEELIYEDRGFKREVYYWKDYEEIVIAGSSQRWCREFSWDTYQRMEERLDLRYHYYKVSAEMEEFDWCEESGRKFFSENLCLELDVVAADGVPEEYVKRCIEHCQYLSANILQQICHEVEEDWGPLEDKPYGIEDFKKDISAGSLVIPKPYGEDIVYILCFEAEFEPEHGISIPIRQDMVLGIYYQADWETPWNYEQEQLYKKKLEMKG